MKVNKEGLGRVIITGTWGEVDNLEKLKRKEEKKTNKQTNKQTNQKGQNKTCELQEFSFQVQFQYLRKKFFSSN